MNTASFTRAPRLWIGLLGFLIGCAGVSACALDTAGTRAGLPPWKGGGGQGGGGDGGMLQGGAGGLGGLGGMGGAGGMPTACGNGLIEVSEDCDDGNTIDGDGCTGCAVDIGYACTGEPSTCAIKPPIEVQTGISIGITDTANHYNGTLASMDCLTLAVGSTDSPQIVQDIKLQVGIDHSYLGDLILKLVSPDNTVLTLMNRPGADEPADGYAENPNGDSSNLSSGYLIEFHDGALVSAESMGDTISGSDVVCKDDGICDFKPAPGKGPGFGFIDFKNKKASGFWRLCAADGDDGDSGTLAFGKLTIWLQ